MKTASWILLAIVGSLMLLVSFLSASLGYRGEYTIGPGEVKVQDVAAGRADVLEGLRGIRGTSAAYAAGYAVLFLAIVLGPVQARGRVGLVGAAGRAGARRARLGGAHPDAGVALGDRHRDHTVRGHADRPAVRREAGRLARLTRPSGREIRTS